MKSFAWITLVLGAASACGDDPPSDDVAVGEAVYRETLAEGNSFTCETCHALSEPTADGFVRPGHPIGNATRRSSYKNGAITDLREAVNTCITDWMNGDPLTEADPRWRGLRAFLEAQATTDAAASVDIQITPPPSDLTGGDPDLGRGLFNTRCVVCHGADADGSDQAPALTFGPLDRDYVAQRVRTSGRTDSATYTGLTGGVMPFWGASRLSDVELIDILAYVEVRSREGAVDGGVGDATMRDGSMPDGSVGGCEATHPRVGQSATLSTLFHGTTGTARVVDDCTIVVEGFGYDGTGIDVRFYGGLGGAYERGFAISDDLLRPGGYSGETLTLTLPAGRTLDDMDGLSLWCVAVGVSFGDGQFVE